MATTRDFLLDLVQASIFMPGDPAPSSNKMLAVAGINHLSALINRLNLSYSGPEFDDDDNLLRPTKHAYETCCALLTAAAIDDAAARAGTSTVAIPLGVASVSDLGGLRVEWIRKDASVHLVVPHDDATVPYVYTEVGNEFKTEDATPEILARSLRHID